MRQQEIKIGSTYTVKVSGKLTSVKITGKSLSGKWIGINLATKRELQFKTGARLRYLADF